MYHYILGLQLAGLKYADLASCKDVPFDTLCEGDGECDTNPNLNNCGVYDVYTKAAPPTYSWYAGTKTDSATRSESGTGRSRRVSEAATPDDSDGCLSCGRVVPVSPALCPDGYESLASCNQVPYGDFCEGDGECGTSEALNNCGRHDVYKKLRLTDVTVSMQSVELLDRFTHTSTNILTKEGLRWLSSSMGSVTWIGEVMGNIAFMDQTFELTQLTVSSNDAGDASASSMSEYLDLTRRYKQAPAAPYTVPTCLQSLLQAAKGARKWLAPVDKDTNTVTTGDIFWNPTTVAYEALTVQLPLEDNSGGWAMEGAAVIANIELVRLGSSKTCLKAVSPTLAGSSVEMSECGADQFDEEEQKLLWNSDTFRIENKYGLCMHAAQRNGQGSAVTMQRCTDALDQQWTFDKSTGRIKSRYGICLDAGSVPASARFKNSGRETAQLPLEESASDNDRCVTIPAHRPHGGQYHCCKTGVRYGDGSACTGPPKCALYGNDHLLFLPRCSGITDSTCAGLQSQTAGSGTKPAVGTFVSRASMEAAGWVFSHNTNAMHRATNPAGRAAYCDKLPKDSYCGYASGQTVGSISLKLSTGKDV